MIEKTWKKIFRTSTLAIAALTLLPASHAIASPTLFLTGTATLGKIRAADHESYQRIVFDTSEAVTFSVVEEGNTLTLALNGITSQLQTRAWTDLGQLKGLKVEPISDTSVLIIFDLAEPMRPRIYSYTPDSYGGHRIVVDLWPTEEPMKQTPPESQEPAPVTHTPETVTSSKQATVPASDPLSATSGPLSATSGPLSATSGPLSESIKTSEMPGSDPMTEPVLKEINQWPNTLDEAAQTIVQKEAAALIMAQPTLDDGMDMATGEELDASGTMNGMITDDPVTAARERMARGSPAEACKVLQVNFPKGTWNIDAMVLQGECLRELGKLTDASALYTEVLSYEPESLAARLGLAHTQVENGDFAAARDNYTRALAKLPPGELAEDTRFRLEKVEGELKHAVH